MRFGDAIKSDDLNLRVRRSRCSSVPLLQDGVERNDTHQLLPETMMGFAGPVIGRAFARPVGSTHPAKCAIFACDVIANAIQHCCSAKTVIAIPPRSRSSTLCESAMPAPTLSAVFHSLAL